MADEDETMASGSESEDESEVEYLAVTRKKRATAGNRYSALLQNEEPDDEVNMLFQDEEGAPEDTEFHQKAEDGASDVDMGSSDDDDDQGPTAGADENDLEGEKEIKKQERAERKRKRKAEMTFKTRIKPPLQRRGLRPDAANSTTTSLSTPEPRPKKKSERASWLPTPEEGPTRSSSRRQTVLNKVSIHERLVESEKKREKIMKATEAARARKEASGAKPLTQADRIAEAHKVEKHNTKSVNRWEAEEKRRQEERQAKLDALKNRKLEGPVITSWSGPSTWLGEKLVSVGIGNKIVEIKEPTKGKPGPKPKNKQVNGAASPEAERPRSKGKEKAAKEQEASEKDKEATAKDQDATMTDAPPPQEPERGDKEASEPKTQDKNLEATDSTQQQDPTANSETPKVPIPETEPDGDAAPEQATSAPQESLDATNQQENGEEEKQEEADTQQEKQEAELGQEQEHPDSNSHEETQQDTTMADSATNATSPTVTNPTASVDTSQQWSTSMITRPKAADEAESTYPQNSSSTPSQPPTHAPNPDVPNPHFTPPVAPPESTTQQPEAATQSSMPAPTPSTDAAAAAALPPPPPAVKETAARKLVILDNCDGPNAYLPEVRDHVLMKSRKAPKITVKQQKAATERCAITGEIAHYRDPRTGLAYATSAAYKEIQRLNEGKMRWSTLLGCFVGPIEGAAKGVPEWFFGKKDEAAGDEVGAGKEGEEADAGAGTG